MQLLKEDKKVKTLYSFDIFDTLVTRKTATPSGIFLVMQELLKNNPNYPEFLKSNFKKIRIETEAFVREQLTLSKNFQDITLEDIYNRIQINYSLTDDETEFLKNFEIESECQNLIPINENIKNIKNLLNNDNNIILISDMYHSEKTLRKILTQIDPIFTNIPIFVSSEYKKTKRQGDLYKLIQNKYTPEKWEHIGDSQLADYGTARKNKIDATLYPYEKLKKYEKIALNKDNISTEYIVGTAKNIRLFNTTKNNRYNFGASFAGPILYSYVSWIIENCQKEKIENLYFIARDGFIPKLIADVIVKEKNLNIKNHYIYGSRKAWRIPNKITIDKFITSIFNEYFYKFSGKFLKERFDITTEELYKYTNLLDNNKVLKSKHRKELFNKLINNQEFKDLIIEKNENKTNLIIKYLQQEIDFSKRNFAFVDINGTGRTQDILKSIILLFSNCPIKTFYFCTDTKLSEYKDSMKKIFMCTPKYKHFWLELLCRNTDGQTLGYKEENGQIIPITENVNPQKLINWGYNEYINGIIDFTKTILAIEKQLDIHINNTDFYYQYYNYIMNNIDKETADILGSIPYSDIGNEKLNKECAPAYNLMTFLLSNIKNNKDTALYFISKERSTKLAKILMNLKIKYKSLRKFFIDIHIHKKRQEAYLCILGIKIDLHCLGYKE